MKLNIIIITIIVNIIVEVHNGFVYLVLNNEIIFSLDLFYCFIYQ